MQILLIGAGGREQALAWKILQSPQLTKLYITAQQEQINFLFAKKPVQTVAISETDSEALVAFARTNAIDLVIIGPEKPLAVGISDALSKAGIRVFGPSQAAAEIETSKSFAKNFMQRHHIPTARFAVFNNFAKATRYLDEISYPIVIKASGLAAGKGVFLPESIAEAKNILQQLLQEKTLGTAGAEILIEERLSGPEVSLLAFSDGVTVLPMLPARDHKRLFDNNQGPNTGGMGAFAPVPECDTQWIVKTTKEILQATIDGLRAEGRPFVGVLYAGLMLTERGPHVIEFNARFGDPETQVLMCLLDSDILTIATACATQRLSEISIQWKKGAAVGVVLAAKGYPDKPEQGKLIAGLDSLVNCQIFPAGMRSEDGKHYTAGGRVLSIVCHDENLAAAIKNSYSAVKNISFEGMQFRTDIGKNTMTNDLYGQSGVNIAAGNQTVKMMTQAVRSTYGAEVLAGIGAFGGMYHAAKIKEMRDPVLVASTDGVGTKVHLAVQANSYRSLGHDIVNHSVNDILVQGARPLFFLDYLACSHLVPETMAEIVTGMSEACRAAHCALLGGETAEMPGVYAAGMLDVAGTIVGIVERDQALPRKDLAAGDLLVGIASSGSHTNGYSLLRKIFADVPLDKVFDELQKPLAEVLLAPHRSYLPVLQVALEHADKPVKGLVHITGGGFLENIPRVLPDNLGAEIKLNSWPVSPLFQLTQKRGQVPTEQMYTVFNMGIGMIVIVAPEKLALLQKLIAEPTWQIGQLVNGKKEVKLV